MRRRYKIVIEDESRIERIAQWRLTRWRIAMFVAVCAILTVGVAVCVIMFTPMRQLLPGYLPEAQRKQTENNLLRIDSLRAQVQKNDAYVRNILELLNTDRELSDTLVSMPESARSTDSLMTSTAEERKFVAAYFNRDRYKMSAQTPTAINGMAFVPVCRNSVIREQSGSSMKAEIVLPRDGTVSSVADGRVIDVSNNIAGGATVVVQHGRGFVSRYSRLANVVVNPGDEILASQVIALQKAGQGRNVSVIGLEIWRNGESLWPGDLIR